MEFELFRMRRNLDLDLVPDLLLLFLGPLGLAVGGVLALDKVGVDDESGVGVLGVAGLGAEDLEVQALVLDVHASLNLSGLKYRGKI